MGKQALHQTERLGCTSWMLCFVQSSGPNIILYVCHVCSSWRLFLNLKLFSDSTWTETPNTHAEHCHQCEFHVSITPKTWAENLTFKFPLMWPHHDEGLTWLKLRPLLTILLCWTNSQFNNKALIKKGISSLHCSYDGQNQISFCPPALLW